MSARELDKAAEMAREAPESLAALALDVISRQAEAKALLAGEGFVRKKAESHGALDEKLGDVDVVDLLERGPTEGADYALIMGLAVAGIRGRLDDAARIGRFLRHADWLTFSTPYPAYAMIDRVLGEDATPVWKVAEESLGRNIDGPKDAAIVALRRAALSESEFAPEDSRQDEDESPEQTLAGELARPPAEGFRAVLRLVSGYALLQWIARGLMMLVRYERTATIEHVRGGITMRSATRILGREIRSREETYTYDALTSVGATTRYPALPFLVGALFFGLGVLVGGFWLFDGVRSGETVLLLLGAGLIALGGALDLALTTFWPARGGRVALDIGLNERRGWRLRRLSPDAAAEFARKLAKAARD